MALCFSVMAFWLCLWALWMVFCIMAGDDKEETIKMFIVGTVMSISICTFQVIFLSICNSVFGF